MIEIKKRGIVTEEKYEKVLTFLTEHAESLGDDEIILQESEVRAYKWVPFNDLKEYLLFDNQLQETTEKIVELFPL